MKTTQSTITRIAASYTGLVRTSTGEYLARTSTVTLHTIDTDDNYTEVESIMLGDLVPMDDFAEDTHASTAEVDAVVDEINVRAEALAALLGLTMTGYDSGDDGTFFWTVSASK